MKQESKSVIRDKEEHYVSKKQVKTLRRYKDLGTKHRSSKTHKQN